MRNCSVLNCSNNNSNKNISFHHFPKDPETRQAWIYATGRLNWVPASHSTICSAHFTEYDFTTRSNKRVLRSTTVPRFNLSEQNSLYTETLCQSETQGTEYIIETQELQYDNEQEVQYEDNTQELQYHNETQAALQFLTGQMFPETQVPAQQPAEVVTTVQVIGKNNPRVVVKKPQPQPKPGNPDKKPPYFSTVNVFKSEAELKAEKDKIHELIRDNLDPSISKILLTLDERPPKKKKKKKDENSNHHGNGLIMPRGKNGQFLKLSKKSSTQLISDPSERHYTDSCTREQIIHKLKQRDLKISQQEIAIRTLQKQHLRDQVELESLRIKLRLTYSEAKVEETSESVVPSLPYGRSNVGYKKPTQPSQQKVPAQKRKKRNKTQTEDSQTTNQYNSNISNQNQIYDTQNRHSSVGLKRPTGKYIITQKRQRLETTNTVDNDQSTSNLSDQNAAYFDTQKRQSDVALKRPAGKYVVTEKRQRLKATNTVDNYQSNSNFLEQNQAYYNTQNRHSNVGLKTPAGKYMITQNRQTIEATSAEDNCSNQHESTTLTQNRHSDIVFKTPARKLIVVQKRHATDSNSTPDQNRHSNVGFKKPASQYIITQKQTSENTNTENTNQSNKNFSTQFQSYCDNRKVVIQHQEIIKSPKTKNSNQSNMIFSDQDRKHFWSF